ncbi:MAG TPA: DUF2207 domain-containing protein [Candidatus Atribacteria bacterium]|nr:DUF2207 domain-containing protein [Candidatus Atribacteria bacterium]
MKKFVLSFWIFILVLFLLPSFAFSKSYFHPSINQSFVLQENGDVEVEEERYFSFSGSFSWAQLTILLRGVKDIDFSGVWSIETGEPLPFQVEEEAHSKSLKWFYQAEDEIKGFRIKYTLRQVVKRYRDVAEFYWKVLEDEHAEVEDLRVSFTLPQASPELLKLFVHAEVEPGEIVFSPDYKRVDFYLSSIPSDTFVEARLLLEPQIFPLLSPLDDNRYEEILQEEERLINEGPQVSRWTIFFSFLLVGGGILYIILFFYYYFRYGKEPKIGYEREYEQEPPRDVSPSLLGSILSQQEASPQVMSRAFLATILDLARRGYLKVEEKEEKKFIGKKNYLNFTFTERGISENKNDALLPLEQEVLELLHRISKEGKSVSTLDIEEWGSEFRGDKSKFSSFIEQWGEKARSFWEEHFFPLLDPLSEIKKTQFFTLGMIYSGIAIFYVFLALTSGNSFWGAFLVIPFIPLALFFAFLSLKSLSRWSKEGALEFKRWQAFRRFISDFSLMKEAPPLLLHIWDRYLVYAVVLGVAEELLKNLKLYAQERGEALVVPTWYHPVGGTFTLASLDGLSQLDNFSNRMENLAHLRQAVSTSTSVGGGFSHGGGGGGGGGSSRAG